MAPGAGLSGNDGRELKQHAVMRLIPLVFLGVGVGRTRQRVLGYEALRVYTLGGDELNYFWCPPSSEAAPLKRRTRPLGSVARALWLGLAFCLINMACEN